MSDCGSGDRPELSVAKVLQLFLPEYLRTHALPVHHVNVLRRLSQCGSGQLGWTLWHCHDCQRVHWRPLACGDRHCPSCQHQRSAAWLEKQRAALLPVRYFHWVFTLPSELRPVALQNPKALYDLLFDCASATLLQFGRERFGAEIGITAILHTWGQNLTDHPHLHCIVTGGGLSQQNNWAGPDQARWLFPHKAVATMFQAKFAAGLLRLHATGKLQFHGKLEALRDFTALTALLRQARSQPWNVFAKGSVAGPESVLQYLGRYTHRVAISNARLRAIDPAAQTVTFLYKDYAHGQQIKPMTLPAYEFIRRFLLHVLPPNFTKIRHYGILGNNQRKQRIPLARVALQTSPLRFEPPSQSQHSSPPIPPARFECPFCKQNHLRCIGRVDQLGKATLFKCFTQLAAAPVLLDSS